MALYFRGYERDWGGERGFQQSQLPFQPLLSRPRLHASGSFQLDLRGERPRGLLMEKGRACPTPFRSHPEPSRPLSPSAGLLGSRLGPLCSGLPGIGSAQDQRGWHLLGGTGPGSGRSQVHLLRPRETMASGRECPLDMTPDGIAALRSGPSWEDIPKCMSDSSRRERNCREMSKGTSA